MEKIKYEDVRHSYNGRSGCMCGCLGKYSLKSADDIEAYNKDAGWEAADESNVSPRAVKIAVNKINKAIDKYGDNKPDPSKVFFEVNDRWASIDEGGRNTTVYF